MEVTDTGCGIAAEERELVFDEFFRGRRSTCAAEEPGLGLGLSIVRRMAQALDHPLTLASRPGHGTRVTLALPVSAIPAAGAPPAPVATRLRARTSWWWRTTPPRPTPWRASCRTGTPGSRPSGIWRACAPPWRRASRRRTSWCSTTIWTTAPAGSTWPPICRAGRTTPLPAIVTTADHTDDVEERVTAAGAELVRKPIKPAQLRSLLTYMLA